MTNNVLYIPELITEAKAAFEKILDLIDGTVEDLLERRGFPEEVRCGRATIHRIRDMDSHTATLLKDAEVIHFCFGESMAFARVAGACTGNSHVFGTAVLLLVIVFNGRSGRI